MNTFDDGSRVCVIGAGCAGLSAAVRLRDKGYEVTVLERRDRVGGKCYTRELEVDGRPLAFDMGATVVALSFRNFLRVGRAVGERTKAVNPYAMIDAAGRVSPMRARYWPSGKRLSLATQLLRYLAHVRRFYAEHVFATGFGPDIPARYHVPFARYCRDNGMADLVAWFEIPIVAWGYGDLEELPTWYVFGEIDLPGALGLLFTVSFGASKLVQAWDNGYGNLLQRMAEHEGLDVRVGVAARAIRRADAGVEVDTDAGTLNFDYLVISAPGAVSALEDRSPAEARFFAEVIHSPYATVLCTIDRELSSKLIVEANLERLDAVKLVAAQHPACASVVCYLNVSAGVDAGQVRAFVERDLDALGIGLREIHEVALWPDYFPRFASYSGYQALLEAQGRRRTVYVGSLNRFEFTESAAASARGVIDAFFIDRVTPGRDRFVALKNAYFLLGPSR